MDLSKHIHTHNSRLARPTSTSSHLTIFIFLGFRIEAHRRYNVHQLLLHSKYSHVTSCMITNNHNYRTNLQRPLPSQHARLDAPTMAELVD